ncbi:MAG: hypothetical protein MUP28_03450 [Candidatus Aminicenantes bacterium]|jgi:hypothetical protein|nr:hypothetical protein [Candidatus Aminicenantes bacterium]
MKKSASFILLAGGVLSVLLMSSCKSMSTDELKKTIEIIDVETKWVSKYYQPWPPRLLLVPVLSFRVKNIGVEPLTYINFNAIFKFKGDPENLGDNFLAAIRGKAIPAGDVSDVITLKSNFGVEGKSVESIRSNPQWKPVEVRLFARSKGSQFVLIGEWDVSRTIDFKEPEPVKVQ